MCLAVLLEQLDGWICALLSFQSAVFEYLQCTIGGASIAAVREVTCSPVREAWQAVQSIAFEICQAFIESKTVLVSHVPRFVWFWNKMLAAIVVSRNVLHPSWAVTVLSPPGGLGDFASYLVGVNIHALFLKLGYIICFEWAKEVYRFVATSAVARKLFATHFPPSPRKLLFHKSVFQEYIYFRSSIRGLLIILCLYIHCHCVLNLLPLICSLDDYSSANKGVLPVPVPTI